MHMICLAYQNYYR